MCTHLSVCVCYLYKYLMIKKNYAHFLFCFSDIKFSINFILRNLIRDSNVDSNQFVFFHYLPFLINSYHFILMEL